MHPLINASDWGAGRLANTTRLFWKYFDVVSFVAKLLYNSFTKLSLFVKLEENVVTSTMLSFDRLSFVSEIVYG